MRKVRWVDEGEGKTEKEKEGRQRKERAASVHSDEGKKTGEKKEASSCGCPIDQRVSRA